MEEKTVVLCGKEVNNLTKIDADYIIICDSGANFAADELTELTDEMQKNDGVSVVTTCGGALSKINSLIFSVASGKNIPIPCGAVGFSRETAAKLTKTVRCDAVSLVMEATLAGVETHAVERKEKNSVSFGKTIRQWWSLFLSSHTLKYIFSSCVAFAVNYVLILVFEQLLSGILHGVAMEIAAIPAWILSSITNFFINRNFVFRSKANLFAALGEYYGLAGIVFLLKTYVLLELLTRLFHLPLGIAMPIAEVLFFIANYFIQKKLIFKKR